MSNLNYGVALMLLPYRFCREASYDEEIGDVDDDAATTVSDGPTQGRGTQRQATVVSPPPPSTPPSLVVGVKGSVDGQRYMSAPRSPPLCQ